MLELHVRKKLLIEPIFKKILYGLTTQQANFNSKNKC